MTVRCKFTCEFVKYNKNGAEVSFVTVTLTSPENESFFKWTPYGSFTMGLVNPETAEHFIPGQEYYIDITNAKG